MKRSTSENDPIQVNFVDGHDLPAAGKLGLTFAPGKKGPAYHSATIWDRDVNSDLQRMVDHYGMTTLVSLMEDFEYPLLEIADLFNQAESQGVEVVHYPIRDVSVPSADAMAGFASLISDITARLAGGETVVAHCRGGLGRTGLVAAAVLVAAGHEPEHAIKAVRSARPRTLETRAQERYVHDFAQYLEAGNAEPV